MRRWLRDHLLPGLIAAIFLLLPAWLRWTATPPFLPDWYLSRHVLLLPMLAAVALWLLVGLPGWRAFRSSRWRLAWAAGLLTLAGWMVVSTAWALMRNREPDVGATAAFQFAVVAGFALVVACAGPRPRTVITMLVIGVVALSALTVAQVAAGHSLGLATLGEFAFGPGRGGGSLLRAGALVFYRPQGLLPHPNIHAGWLMAGVLASAALWFDRRRGVQLLGAALTAMGMAALLLTFSRSALLGLAVGGVVGLVLVWPRLRRGDGVRAVLLAAGLCALVAALLFAVYAPFFSARVEASEGVELRSVADRIVFTDFALRAIGEHPVLGVGAGNFPWQTSYYLQETFYDLRGDNVHNIYLLTAAELGLIGLALLGTALVSGLASGGRSVGMGTGGRDADRAALLAIVVALLTVGLFDHYPATIFQAQALLWGCLAAAMAIPRDSANGD